MEMEREVSEHINALTKFITCHELNLVSSFVLGQLEKLHVTLTNFLTKENPAHTMEISIPKVRELVPTPGQLNLETLEDAYTLQDEEVSNLNLDDTITDVVSNAIGLENYFKSHEDELQMISKTNISKKENMAKGDDYKGSGIGNCIVKKINKLYHCNLCNADMSDMNIVDIHVSGKKHQKKMMDQIVTGEQDKCYILEKNVIMYTCNACKENMRNEESVDKHIITKSHQMKLSGEKEDSVVKAGEGMYFCTICSVSVSGSSSSVIEHMRGKNHRKKLEIGSISKSECSDVSLNIPHELEDVSHISIRGEKEAFCEVCRIRVPNTRKNISEHVQGGQHKRACDSFSLNALN